MAEGNTVILDGMSDDDLIGVGYAFFEDCDSESVRRAREIIRERGLAFNDKKLAWLRKKRFESLKGTERDFQNIVDELKRDLARNKNLYPAVNIAYAPSGKISVAARLVLSAMLPFVVVAFIMLSRLVVFLFSALGTFLISKFGFTAQDDMDFFMSFWGYAMLFVNVIILLVISLGISVSFASIGKRMKSRNYLFASALSTIAAVIAAGVVYLPVFNGQSMAPVDVTLTFFDCIVIPLKWPMIAGGVALAPVIAWFVTKEFVCNQRFCEVTGHFLEMKRGLEYPFYAFKDIQDSLTATRFDELAKIPRAAQCEISKGHYCHITLWYNKNAETAYIDVFLYFLRSIDKFRIDKGGQIKKHKESEWWLALSMESTRLEADNIMRLKSSE